MLQGRRDSKQAASARTKSLPSTALPFQATENHSSRLIPESLKILTRRSAPISWPWCGFGSLTRTAPFVMNSWSVPVNGPLNPRSPSRRISSRLDTGISLFDNRHRLQRHKYCVAIDRRDGMPHSQAQYYPSFNCADKLPAAFFNGLAGGPHSRQPGN
jgi:hypothetical protein